MSQIRSYKINSTNVPLKGMNCKDERWNMGQQYFYDLLNGYITKSASGQTLIKQRYGFKKVHSTNAFTDQESYWYKFRPGIKNLNYWTKADCFLGIIPSYKTSGGVKYQSYNFKTLTLGDSAWTRRDTSTNLPTDGDDGLEYVMRYDKILFNKSVFGATNKRRYFESDWSLGLWPNSDLPTLPRLCYYFTNHSQRLIGIGRSSNGVTRPLYFLCGSIVNGFNEIDAWNRDNDAFTIDLSEKINLRVNLNMELFSLYQNMIAIIIPEKLYIYNIPVYSNQISIVQEFDLNFPIELAGSGSLGNLYKSGFIQKIGNDFYIINSFGIKKISFSLSDNRFNLTELSNNIQNLWDDLIWWNAYYNTTYKDYEGWNLSPEPIGRNLPIQVLTSHKYNQIWISIPQRISSCLDYVSGDREFVNIYNLAVPGGGTYYEYINDNPDYKSQILIFDIETHEFIGRYETPFNITSIHEHPLSLDIYVGTDTGFMFKYDEDIYTDEYSEYDYAAQKIIYNQRIIDTASDVIIAGQAAIADMQVKITKPAYAAFIEQFTAAIIELQETIDGYPARVIEATAEIVRLNAVIAAGSTTTPITFSFKPMYIGNESPDNLKSLKSLSLICETNQATDLTLNYSIQPIADKSDAAISAISETIPLALSAGNNYDYDLIGRGKMIDIELTHTVSGSRVTIGQITVNADIEGTE